MYGPIKVGERVLPVSPQQESEPLVPRVKNPLGIEIDKMLKKGE